MKIQITQQHIKKALETSDRTTNNSPLKVALKEQGKSWIGLVTDVFTSGFKSDDNYKETALGRVSIGEFEEEIFYMDEEVALHEARFREFVVQRSWGKDTGFEYPEGEINLLDSITENQAETLSNVKPYSLPDWD